MLMVRPRLSYLINKTAAERRRLPSGGLEQIESMVYHIRERYCALCSVLLYQLISMHAMLFNSFCSREPCYTVVCSSVKKSGADQSLYIKIIYKTFFTVKRRYTRDWTAYHRGTEHSVGVVSHYQSRGQEQLRNVVLTLEKPVVW